MSNANHKIAIFVGEYKEPGKPYMKTESWGCLVHYSPLYGAYGDIEIRDIDDSILFTANEKFFHGTFRILTPNNDVTERV